MSLDFDDDLCHNASVINDSCSTLIDYTEFKALRESINKSEFVNKFISYLDKFYSTSEDFELSQTKYLNEFKHFKRDFNLVCDDLKQTIKANKEYAEEIYKLKRENNELKILIQNLKINSIEYRNRHDHLNNNQNNKSFENKYTQTYENVDEILNEIYVKIKFEQKQNEIENLKYNLYALNQKLNEFQSKIDVNDDQRIVEIDVHSIYGNYNSIHVEPCYSSLKTINYQEIKELRESYKKQEESNANDLIMDCSINAFQNEIDQIEESIRKAKHDYSLIKDSVNEEHLDLVNDIETKLNKIHQNELKLANKKTDYEHQLSLSGLKIALEQSNAACIKYMNQELDAQLEEYRQQNSELETQLDKQKYFYETQMSTLNEEVDAVKTSIKTQKDSFKSDLDIALRSIQTDMSINYDNLINAKEEYIRVLEKRANKQNYILLKLLADDQQKNLLEESLTNTSTDLITLNQDDTACCNNVHSTAVNVTQYDEVVCELRRALDDRDSLIRSLKKEIEDLNGNDYKEKYINLLDKIESYSESTMAELQAKLEDTFKNEINNLNVKNDANVANLIEDHREHVRQLAEEHEQQISLLNENNRIARQVELEQLLADNKKFMDEMNARHKRDVEVMESQFEHILNNEIKLMKIELKQANKNSDVDIKFRYVAEHKTTQITQIDENHKISVTPYDNINQSTEMSENTSLLDENSSILLNDESMDKHLIEIETASTSNAFVKDLTSPHKTKPVSNGNAKHVELEDKISQLEERNKILKEALEKIYEKEDVFMASTRRQNEEHDNFVKLLQSDIQQLKSENEQLSNERNTLVQNNHNLFNILSKSVLANATTEDHINRRLAKLIHSQHLYQQQFKLSGSASSSKQTSGVTSPKNPISASNPDSLFSPADNGDTDSNGGDELSDEGLDMSQRVSDSLFQHNIEISSEEVILETHTRVQSSIDKILSMFEDTTKQLYESHIQQTQLVDRLEESKIKLMNVQNENDEKIKEFNNKLNYYEGLVNAYDDDMSKKRVDMELLERRLEQCTNELYSAHNEITREKSELSNLEYVRKDLVAQRDLFSNELNDSSIKVISASNKSELIRVNSCLLDEKHDLEYKLNRTLDTSEKQIKDLEACIETLNEQIRVSKEHHDLELQSLKKEMEAMETSIRNDKLFLDNQLAEFEQEKDEYEAKIRQLQEYISRKENMMSDHEDNVIFKNKEYEVIVKDQTERITQLTQDNDELEKILVEKEQSLASLTDLMRHYEKQIEERMMANDSSDKKFAQIKSENEILMQAVKRNAEQLDDYKEKANLYEMNAQNYKEEIERLEKDKEDLILEQNELQVQLYNQRSKVSELELHKKELETNFKLQINDLQEKLKSNKLIVLDKDSQIQKLNEEVEQLKEEIETKINVHLHHQSHILSDTKNETIFEYEREISQLKDDIAALNKTNGHLSSQIEKFQESENSMNDITQKLLDAKNDEIDDLQNRIKYLQDENEKYSELSVTFEQLKNEKEKFINEHQKNIDDFASEMKTLQEENHEIAEKCEELKELINEQDYEIQKEKDQNAEHEKAIENNEITICLLNDKLNEKDEEISNLNSMIYKLSEEINDLKIQTVELRELNKNIQIKSETKLSQQVAELSKPNEELVTKIKDFENEIHKIKQEKAALEEKANLMETYELKINEYEIKNVELESKIDELIEERHEKEEKLLSIEKHQIQSDIKFDLKLKEREKQIEILKYEIEREREQTQFEHDETVIELKTRQSELEVRICELEESKVRLEQKLIEYDVHMNEKSLEVSVLKVKLNDTNFKNSDLLNEIDSKFKNEIDTYEEKIKELEASVDSMTKLKQASDVELANLRNSKANTDQQLVFLQKLIQENGNKMNELEKYRHEQDSQIEQLERYKIENDTELSEKLDIIQNLSQINELLNVRLNDTTRERNDLEEVINENKANFAKQLNDHQNEIKRLLNENDENKKALKDQIEHLSQQLQNLEADRKIETEKHIQLLERKHIEELKKVKDTHIANMRTELESDLRHVQEEHLLEIEKIKQTYEQLITEKTEEIRRDAHHEAEKRIEELKQHYEKELNDLDRSSSGESTVSYDLGNKLKEQVKLTQELDSRLIVTLKNSKEKDPEPVTAAQPAHVSSRIKQILEKLDKEGVMLLSLSELLQLKTHLSQKETTNAKALMSKVIAQSFENEKEQLTRQVHELRELLSKLNENPNNVKDWRGDVVNGVANVFREEQKLALAELRTFISTNAQVDENKVKFFENKLNKQDGFFESALNTLLSADRQSILSEIKSLKDEHNRLQDEIRRLQDAERQLKRELQLMEYNKDAENIKANDFKQSLNTEKSKNFEILEKLNQERKLTNKLQEQLADLKEEIGKMRTNIDSESDTYQSLCKQLDDEKDRNYELNGYVENLRLKCRELEDHLHKKDRHQRQIAEKETESDRRAYVGSGKNRLDYVQSENSGVLSEHDREKFKKLYYKYLRAESFRKSLIYQKKFLLIMLSGYEDTEREILATLKLDPRQKINEYSTNGVLARTSSLYSNRFLINSPINKFRTGVLCIVAIHRIKYLIRKHSHVHSNALTRLDSNR